MPLLDRSGHYHRSKEDQTFCSICCVLACAAKTYTYPSLPPLRRLPRASFLTHHAPPYRACLSHAPPLGTLCRRAAHYKGTLLPVGAPAEHQHNEHALFTLAFHLAIGVTLYTRCTSYTYLYLPRRSQRSRHRCVEDFSSPSASPTCRGGTHRYDGTLTPGNAPALDTLPLAWTKRVCRHQVVARATPTLIPS